MFLWPFNVAGKHKTSLALHVKCLKCVLGFNEMWILCFVVRASRYNCKEKPTWCTTYSWNISSTSTCFGRI